LLPNFRWSRSESVLVQNTINKLVA
jgi:hypothetical protein